VSIAMEFIAGGWGFGVGLGWMHADLALVLEKYRLL